MLGIAQLKPGRTSDGGGLYVEVKPDGRRYFIFRDASGSKLRWKSLGPTTKLSLKAARELAKRYNDMIARSASSHAACSAITQTSCQSSRTGSHRLRNPRPFAYVMISRELPAHLRRGHELGRPDRPQHPQCVVHGNLVDPLPSDRSSVNLHGQSPLSLHPHVSNSSSPRCACTLLRPRANVGTRAFSAKTGSRPNVNAVLRG